MSDASNSTATSRCPGKRSRTPVPSGGPVSLCPPCRPGPARPYNTERVEPVTATCREAQENSWPAVGAAAGPASTEGPPRGPSLQEALQPGPLDAPMAFTPAPWGTMGIRGSVCNRHGNPHLGVPALQTGKSGLREFT